MASVKVREVVVCSRKVKGTRKQAGMGEQEGREVICFA